MCQGASCGDKLNTDRMKAWCHGCGKFKEVFSWLEREWEGGDEEYDPLCKDCSSDVTGEWAEEAEG